MKLAIQRFITGVLLVLFISACASPAGDGPFYKEGERELFTFRLGLGKSLASSPFVRYKFGDLPERALDDARYNGGVFVHQMLPMRVPEVFQVWWTSSDSSKHYAEVIVRERIFESLRGKSLLFRVEVDRVEGFISTPTTSGENLVRFH